MVSKLVVSLACLCLLEAQGFVLERGPWQGIPIGQRSAFVTALRISENDANNNNDNKNGYHVNGFPSQGNIAPPGKSKADLYSNEELQNLLNLHQSLNQNGGFASSSVNATEEDSFLPLGLHDMVLQTLDGMNTTESVESVPSVPSPESAIAAASSAYSLSSEARRVLTGIRAIASDVDGTLVASDQTIHHVTQQAVQKAVQQTQSSSSSETTLKYFFPATGKTRTAVTSLGPPLASLLSNCPGVFVQGLYCVNAEGDVIYEEKLSARAADAVIAFAEAAALADNLSILAYDGNDIYATPRANPCHVRDVHEVWGEPRPILVDTLLGYEPQFHKVLLWSDDTEAINEVIRPQLEQLAADNQGSVTQAIPTMLEFLPQGASKARGVQKLCEYLGIDMGTELLAIGDAENDIGFLQQSAFGVAVGNAVPLVKEAADLVLEETNNDGGAGVAINLFGLGEALE